MKVDTKIKAVPFNNRTGDVTASELAKGFPQTYDTTVVNNTGTAIIAYEMQRDPSRPDVQFLQGRVIHNGQSLEGAEAIAAYAHGRMQYFYIPSSLSQNTQFTVRMTNAGTVDIRASIRGVGTALSGMGTFRSGKPFLQELDLERFEANMNGTAVRHMQLPLNAGL